MKDKELKVEEIPSSPKFLPENAEAAMDDWDIAIKAIRQAMPEIERETTKWYILNNLLASQFDKVGWYESLKSKR